MIVATIAAGAIIDTTVLLALQPGWQRRLLHISVVDDVAVGMFHVGVVTTSGMWTTKTTMTSMTTTMTPTLDGADATTTTITPAEAAAADD